MIRCYSLFSCSEGQYLDSSLCYGPPNPSFTSTVLVLAAWEAAKEDYYAATDCLCFSYFSASMVPIMVPATEGFFVVIRLVSLAVLC